jgi:hypothetical protein
MGRKIRKRRARKEETEQDRRRENYNENTKGEEEVIQYACCYH